MLGTQPCWCSYETQLFFLQSSTWPRLCGVRLVSNPLRKQIKVLPTFLLSTSVHFWIVNFFGTRWRSELLFQNYPFRWKRCQTCARGSRWGPQLWAAVSCNPAWSMLRPVTSQLPRFAEGQGRGRGEARTAPPPSVLGGDQRLSLGGSQFHVCQPGWVPEPVLKCNFDPVRMGH